MAAVYFSYEADPAAEQQMGEAEAVEMAAQMASQPQYHGEIDLS